jgi:hypothetical protein
MSSRTLDAETIARIKTLREFGLSWRKIGKILGMGHGRARYYCTKFDPAKVIVRNPNKERDYKARIRAQYGLSIGQWERRRRWAKEEARKTGVPLAVIYERWGI